MKEVCSMFSIKQLSSESKCRKLLEDLVFGEDLHCPKCKTTLFRSSKYYWCKTCRKKYYLRSLIGFPRSKLKYREILITINAWQRNVPPGGLKHTLGLAYPTISRWYSKLRKRLPQDITILNGIAEVDEAFYGRRKYNNQKIVIGAIERKSGQIRLREIPDRDQDSIEIFLDKNVHPESFLHTDAWTSYYDIMWCGYGHRLHNHSKGQFGGTAKIENVWSVSKRQVRRMYGQIKTTKLPEFLVEWEARFNFPELFKNPLTYIQSVLVPY
jgi:transposase-like protein